MFQKIKKFLFINQTVRQTITKNTFWLFFGQTIGRLIRAGIVIYAVRVLGPEGSGVISFALGIAAMFTIFADIGINGLIAREGSRHPELRKPYLATAFFIKLVMLGIVAVLILTYTDKLTNNADVKIIMPLMILVFAFDSLRDLAVALARAIEKMEIEAFGTILTNIAVATLGFIALSTTPETKPFALAYAMGTGIGFMATIIPLRSYYSNLFQSFSAKLIKPIITAAWPFGLMGLMGAVMINTDVLMLGWMRSIGEVGLYSAAQKPILLLYIIPTLVSSAFFPAFARLAETDKEKFKNLFETALTIVLLIAAPLALGGILVGSEVINTLYTTQFANATLTFKILAATLVLVFPGTIIGNAIFAHNEQKRFIGYVVMGIVGNIIFNLLLIPRWGIEGAAFSTLINQIIINAYLWYRMKKVSDFAVVKRVTKVIYATLGMGVMTYIAQFAGISIWITLVLSFLVYGGLLIAMKEPLLKALVTLHK